MRLPKNGPFRLACAEDNSLRLTPSSYFERPACAIGRQVLSGGVCPTDKSRPRRERPLGGPLQSLSLAEKLYQKYALSSAIEVINVRAMLIILATPASS